MFPKNWWDVFIYVCLRIFSITNLLNAGDYFSHEQTRFLHHQGVSCHVLQSHHSIFFEKENKWIKGHTFYSCCLKFIHLIDTLHRILVYWFFKMLLCNILSYPYNVSPQISCCQIKSTKIRIRLGKYSIL